MSFTTILACPTHDLRISAGTGAALWSTASQIQQAVVIPPQGNSLLAKNFNGYWCYALNARKLWPLKWFAMLHSDIEPQPWWLDVLIEEAEKHDADMLSAVVAIKNGNGFSSTAIARPGAPFHPFGRLTLRQVHHPSFPKTFGINEACDALANLPPELRATNVPREALLVNTGCFVARIDRPWCEKVHFEIRDRIECVNGVWVPRCEPEDWGFSRQLVEQGAKVMATTRVHNFHWGVQGFPSDYQFGVPVDMSPTKESPT